MTAPLLISFDVDCSADHAFNVWTSKIGTWWPSEHTVSGDPEEIVLEGYPGGRIYERTSTGERHEWGEVTTWEPPRRLSYLWHIGRERETATEVEISFIDEGVARARGSTSRTAGGTRWVKTRRPDGTRTAVVGMHWCRTSWRQSGRRAD